MGTSEKIDMVVVFDLDDTLYAEYDYQTSGINAVGKAIKELYGIDLTRQILDWRTEGEMDLWGRACCESHLPISVKDSLLWIYRLHQPEIMLDQTTFDALAEVKLMVKEIVILTDGRSVTQRKKLNALGLGDVRAYISEDYQSEKPCPARFQAIMQDNPASRYLYVADNPEKDFIAPITLGWQTIGLRGGVRGIYRQSFESLPIGSLPAKWISSLNELKGEIERVRLPT